MISTSAVYKLDTSKAQVLELTVGASVTSAKAIRAYAVLLLATVDCHITLSSESDVIVDATLNDFLLKADQYFPISCYAGGSIAAIPATAAGQLYVTPIVSQV